MKKVVRKDGHTMSDKIDIHLVKANIKKLSGKVWYDLELNRILPIVTSTASLHLRDFCLGKEFTYICGDYYITAKWDMVYTELNYQSWEMLSFIETIYKQYNEKDY